MGDASGCAVLRSARLVLPGSLGRWTAEAPTAICLFPIWRRAADLHRGEFRHDGGGHHSVDAAATGPLRAGTPPPGGRVARVHASAALGRPPPAELCRLAVSKPGLLPVPHRAVHLAAGR